MKDQKIESKWNKILYYQKVLPWIITCFYNWVPQSCMLIIIITIISIISSLCRQCRAGCHWRYSRCHREHTGCAVYSQLSWISCRLTAHKHRWRIFYNLVLYFFFFARSWRSVKGYKVQMAWITSFWALTFFLQVLKTTNKRTWLYDLTVWFIVHCPLPPSMTAILILGDKSGLGSCAAATCKTYGN